MKRTMQAAIAGLLAASLSLSGPTLAMAENQTGDGGSGYQCEVSAHHPNPVSADDLGSRRALRSDNALSDSFRTGFNHFSMKTTAAVLSDGQENKNFSPVSLYYALSLAAQGSEGATKDQLMTLLGAQDQAPGQLADGCGRMYRQMYQADEHSRLKLANSLWLQNGLPLLDGYRRAAENQFYASVFRVNFADDRTGSIIGSWISSQTDQSITPTIKVYDDEVMRIVNTVSYHSEWIQDFKKENNTEGTFFLADGQQTACTYMTDTRSCSYYRGQGYLRAALNLKGNGTMFFILPDEGTDIPSLLSSEETMQQMFGSISAFDSYGRISWKIPKFRIASSMELKPVLKSLGITDGFDREKADFSGITSEPLYLHDVIQETVVGIDENGVEASAYTMVPMGAGSSMAAETIEMTLDRPFLYAIVTDPGVPLFIGVCYNPAS